MSALDRGLDILLIAAVGIIGYGGFTAVSSILDRFGIGKEGSTAGSESGGSIIPDIVTDVIENPINAVQNMIVAEPPPLPTGSITPLFNLEPVIDAFTQAAYEVGNITNQTFEIDLGAGNYDTTVSEFRDTVNTVLTEGTRIEIPEAEVFGPPAPATTYPGYVAPSYDGSTPDLSIYQFSSWDNYYIRKDLWDPARTQQIWGDPIYYMETGIWR